MSTKRALIISFIFHLFLVIFVSKAGNFSFSQKPKNLSALEAKLVFKGKARDKELLPRKKKEPKASLPVEKKEEIAKIKPPSEAKPKLQEQKPQPTPKPVKAESANIKKIAPKQVEVPKKDFAQQLAKLSQAFSDEVINTDNQSEESEYEDHSYYDQIYSLIKEAFIVPPHVNGPQGMKLQAVIRIYLEKNGSLSKLKLERSSGDDHFDNAVLDGAKRVSNFGQVPVLLQKSLNTAGVVVELCPFKCGN